MSSDSKTSISGKVRRHGWKVTVDVAALAGLAAAVGFGVSEHAALHYTRQQLNSANERLDTTQAELQAASLVLAETNDKSGQAIAALHEIGCGTGQLHDAQQKVRALQDQIKSLVDSNESLKRDRIVLAGQLEASKSNDPDNLEADYNELVRQYNAQDKKRVTEYNALAKQFEEQDAKRVKDYIAMQSDYNALVEKYNNRDLASNVFVDNSSPFGALPSITTGHMLVGRFGSGTRVQIVR